MVGILFLGQGCAGGGTRYLMLPIDCESFTDWDFSTIRTTCEVKKNEVVPPTERGKGAGRSLPACWCVRCGLTMFGFRASTC
jgi:hypothetical protein